MKTKATKTAKTTEQMKKDYLKEVSKQVAMAFADENTPEAVSDCLRTIIIEASTEADLYLSDFDLVESALPNIIENLSDDYGRGFLHSIHAIIQHDTTAFRDFYERRLDEKTEVQTETKLVETAVESAAKDKSQRLYQMEAKLSVLLNEAETMDEVKKAMPKCRDFFKLLTSAEFVSLLNTTESKAVRYALWYHFGETMHKAINKCALASTERMMLLYPLFRLYADESDTYI